MKTTNSSSEFCSSQCREHIESISRASRGFKPLFTLLLLLTFSIGNLWAYYTPTADEVIILKDVYSASATTTGYSTHSAVAWAGTASTNSKKAGDPNNGGASTSSNVPCYSVKGNGGGKNITLSITSCSKIIIYHEKHSSRYVELRDGSKTGTLIGNGSANTFYTEVSLTGSIEYSIFLHGTTGTDDQDFNVYAIKLIKASGGGGGGGDTPSGPVDPTATFSNGKYIIGGEDLDLSSLFTSNSDGAVTYSITDAGTTDAALRADGKSFYATTAGPATVKASQAATSAYNAVEKTATITVAELVPSSSINIEQNVLDHGKSWGVTAALAAANIVVDGANGLDSLDDGSSKKNRNYGFLGLKLKKKADIITIVVPAGKTLKVKLGNVGVALSVKINGVAGGTVAKKTDGYSSIFQLEAASSVREVVFYSSDAQTVTLQQVKIGADVDAITLPYKVTYAVGDHGTCLKASETWWGTALTLPSVSVEEGWDFNGWSDGTTIYAAGDSYTPTANVTLTAQYTAQASGTDLETLTYRIGSGAEVAVGYSAGTFEYNIELDYKGSYDPITVSATPVSGASIAAGAQMTVSSLPGSATFTVTDGTNEQPYAVNFSMKPKDGLCIIKATHTGATTADVEGLIGGIYDKNTQGGGKLGSNDHYFGIKLAEGTFKAGDMVEIYASTTSTKVQIFSDKGTTMLDDGVFDGNYYKFTLTAATEWIYLYRTSTAGSAMNPTLGYIAVYRPMNPVLTAITIDGVDGVINEAAKKVSVQLPYTADLANLDVQPTIAWNGAAATNAIQVISNSGNWVEGNNIYRITDKDGDYSDYQITLNRAEASHDATLSELTVNGNAIALIPGQFVYEYEFPKGTPATPAPVVAAVANDSHRHSLDITQANSASGSAEIVVVAEDEKTTKTYTINFSISKWDEVVIWDGSTMSEVATSPDATGLAWEVKVKDSRFKVASYSSASYEDKGYLKYIGTGGTAANDYHFSVTIPKGYVAKLFIVFGAHSDDANGRGLFVGETISSAAIDGIYNKVSTIRNTLTGGYSELIGGNLLETKTYYINPTKSVDIYEVRVFLRRGCIREDMLGKGVLGTICVDHNVAMEDAIGASFYTLVGKEPEYGKIVFDEIISGELEAGKPYIFQADGDRLLLLFGEDVVSEPDNSGALKGTFVDLPIYPEDAAGVYYFRDHALWSARQTGVLIGANRAYLQMDEVNPISSPHPAPGCRRITIGVNSTNSAQGIDETEATEKPIKIMIEGQLFILRGAKRYDATGRLVK